MKISILDQVPVSSGKTAGEALQASLELAQLGEKLGYSRYWIAEHHDFEGLACSAPEVMLAYIGANTEKIRIGSGAVLLPHYKPYKVAETFNMLATLFPNRIDLGIGRAPGGSAEATMALSDNFLDQIRKMPDSVKELLHFLHHDFPSDHMYSKVSAAPVPAIAPDPWILGTSEKSALLAAKNGTAYAFGQFMSEKDGTAILQSYKLNFKERGILERPKTLIAVSVICSETIEKAEELAQGSFLWKIKSSKGEENSGIPSIEEVSKYTYTSEENEMIKGMRNKIIIGNPQMVKQQLTELEKAYQADEIMVVTITHSYEARMKSYELLASELLF